MAESYEEQCIRLEHMIADKRKELAALETELEGVRARWWASFDYSENSAEMESVIQETMRRC